MTPPINPVAARALVLATVMLVAAVQAARSQTYPERTVRVIVPTSPGGGIDVVARTITAHLASEWNQAVIVENRAGAAMRVGVESVAKSAADGYTLLVVHDGAMAMNPALYSDLRYDPQKDFDPIALMVSVPEVVMVSAKTPFSSLGQILDFARKNPGKLNHATGGPASLLDLELLKSMADIDIRSVQYRGAAPAVTGLMAGEVEVCITDLASARPAMQSDRVRPLAVTTGKRLKQYPRLPTVDEAGVPGYVVQVWIGMFAPAGAPKDVLQRIEAGVREALASPAVQQKLATMDIEMRSGRADELRETLAADIAKWDKLVEERHLRIAQ
jgi:tripartite-type tricarboxylate transporter receptor subunit TctC